MSASKKSTLLQPPVSNPEGIAPVYANNVGISATMTDFTLHFVEVGQVAGDGPSQAYNKLKASVTLPMPAALAITAAVNEMLKNAQAHMAQARLVAQGAKKSSGPQ